jgi:membrane-bound lytic murein transglycosylase MltF
MLNILDSSDHGWVSRHGNTPRRTAIVLGLTALVLLAWGCSKESVPQQAQEQTKAEPKKDTESTALDSDGLPPILRAPWKGDLNEMVKRRVVRVLLPYRRPEFFFMDGRPAGILAEAFQELERVINTKYKTSAANRIVVAPLPTSIDRLRERMVAGYGDIAAFGISITENNRQIVDFTIPTITGLKIIVVTGPGAPEVKSVEDLSGKEVWVIPQTRLRDDINALNARLQAQGKAPAIMREADPVLEPGDVMEMVNAGSYPISLVQSQQAEFWGQVFDRVKVRADLVVSNDVELGWAIQKGTPQLKAFLDDFLKTHGVGTSFGNTLLRRYLQSAKYVRNATEESEFKKLQATAPIFRKYAAKYDLDPLMMAAQGYQESTLDQKVKSPVGAVGIMQVMPSTAASAPVKIANINIEENNIHAGMRLVHFLINDYFKEPGLDRMNRTLFAIAAYNAGPEKIRRCRALAASMNYNPNVWFGNVEVAVAKVVGRETTQYVANIYKYYVAYRLASEAQKRRTAAPAK